MTAATRHPADGGAGTGPFTVLVVCTGNVNRSALGAVLQAEIGKGPIPTLTSSSTTANGAVRTWSTVGDFTQEVSMARIYDGVHYRNSTEVGSAMGQKIGELVVKSLPKSTP